MRAALHTFQSCGRTVHKISQRGVQKWNGSVKRKSELTYSKKLRCEYERKDKSTHRSGQSAHFPPTQRRLWVLGEKRGTSRLLAAGTVHLFQTFLLWVETRLLLCAPRPVGVHQQVKKKRGPLLVLFPPPHLFSFLSFLRGWVKKKKIDTTGLLLPCTPKLGTCGGLNAVLQSQWEVLCGERAAEK